MTSATPKTCRRQGIADDIKIIKNTKIFTCQRSFFRCKPTCRRLTLDYSTPHARCQPHRQVFFSATEWKINTSIIRCHKNILFFYHSISIQFPFQISYCQGSSASFVALA